MSPRIFVKKRLPDIHHISRKNHGVEDYIDTAMRAWNIGLPIDNDVFLDANEFLKGMRRRAQEVNE